MDVANHVTIVSCVTPFFPKNSPLASTRHKNYHHDEDIFHTTPLWKQQRSNETSTMLRWTALYSMLFRLICTAIATPLRSETYRVIHHRYNFSHRTTPLWMSSNRDFCINKQYTEGVDLLLASKQSEYQVPSYNNEGMKLLPHKKTRHGPCRANELVTTTSATGNINGCHSLDVIRWNYSTTHEAALISQHNCRKIQRTQLLAGTLVLGDVSRSRLVKGSLKLLWSTLKTNMSEAVIHTINECIALVNIGRDKVGGSHSHGKRYFLRSFTQGNLILPELNFPFVC